MNSKFLLEFEKILLILIFSVILSKSYKKIKYIEIPTTNNSITLNLKNLFQNNGTKKNYSIIINKNYKNNFYNFSSQKYYLDSIKKKQSNRMYFNISFVIYSFSFKFNMSKIEYYIGFYENNNIIHSSNIIFYKDIHVLCHTVIRNNNKTKNIYYLPNIYEDKFFKCVEFFKINETLDFRVKIYKPYKKIMDIKLLDEKAINYNNLKYINDNIFDPLIINE